MIQSSLCTETPRIGLLMVFVIVAGCSSPGEDVRVILCKDIAAGTLDPRPQSVNWSDASTNLRRAEDLAVTVKAEAILADGRSQPLTATCLYRHDAVDETALTIANPMAAYSTSPYRLTVNGRAVGGRQLAEVIKQAMLRQGRAFLERAQQGAESAVRHVRDELRGDSLR